MSNRIRSEWTRRIWCAGRTLCGPHFPPVACARELIPLWSTVVLHLFGRAVVATVATHSVRSPG